MMTYRASDIIGRIYFRLKAILAQRMERALFDSVRPSMIANFSVTSKCNFFCESCNIGRDYLDDPKSAESDLSTDDLIGFIEENGDALKHVVWIQFTGGEPFLRDDIDRIILAYGRRLPNCGFWIPTNGWLPDRICEKICSMLGGGIDRLGVGISLHGNSRQHDAYSGRTHAYDRAMETLKRAVGIGKQYSRFRVSASFTITPGNVDSLVDTYDQCTELGADFTCRIANSSEFYYRYRNTRNCEPGFIEMLQAQLELIEKRMGFRKAFVNPLYFPRWRYYRGILEYARHPERVQMPCRAGQTSVFITSRGAIHPCLFMDTPMGNIRDERLLDILNSPENRRLQNRIQSGACPNCWVECEIYRVLNENLFRVMAFGLRETVSNWFQRS